MGLGLHEPRVDNVPGADVRVHLTGDEEAELDPLPYQPHYVALKF